MTFFNGDVHTLETLPILLINRKRIKHMSLGLGCIVTRIDNITQEYFSNPAIVWGEKITSYGDMQKLSMIYAHWLEKLGIREFNRVLVDLARSDIQIIIQIALLRLGAVYVPRNTDIQDISKIIHECQIKYFIGRGENLLTHCRYIDLESIPDSILYGETPTGYSVIRSPDHPVCILTTSGTTGEPKYLMLPNRSHLNLLTGNWFCPFSSKTRFLYHSLASFDAATVEIWGALLNGGAVVISQTESFDISAMHKEISDSKVNTLWLTSAAFSNIANYRMDFFSNLKYLMTGGDIVCAADVRNFKATFPDIDIVNCWGPAENGTFSTCARFERNTPIKDPLHIGKAINGVNVYIINEEEVVTEPGVAGKIYVSGNGLFLGYVRKGEVHSSLTYHPLLDMPLYDTGDYGEYTVDADIQFIGRRDDMVKIAGKRVYLGNVKDEVVDLLQVQYCYAKSVGAASNKMIDLYIIATSDQHLGDGWKGYHDRVYKDDLLGNGKENVYAGWIDNNTGESIAIAQMTQWKNEYLARIKLLSCSTYLDVGCGSGVVPSGLDNIIKYLGVDYSQPAIKYLTNKFESEHHDGQYDFISSDANEFFSNSPQLIYEVVLINSVITYLGNKYKVKELLSLIACSVSAKYLYLGDIVNDAILMSPLSFKRTISYSDSGSSLHELTFTFSEIYSLLRQTFGEAEVIFVPKLCSDLNLVFRRRYDVLVVMEHLKKKVDRTDIKLLDLASLQETDFVSSQTVIQVGEYEKYVNSLDKIRALSENVLKNGLQLLPFFDSVKSQTVALAISTNPIALVSSFQCIDVEQNPVCGDELLTNQLEYTVKKYLGNKYPIRNVQLLYYLPSTSRGKIDREWFTAFENSSMTSIDDSIESKIFALFNIKSQARDVSIFEIGITSLQLTRISLQLENVFKIKITTKHIFELRTVSNIVNYIRSNSENELITV